MGRLSCLAFRGGNDLRLQSLARYFPEVVAEVRTVMAKRFVLDGEFVIPERDASGFSF